MSWLYQPLLPGGAQLLEAGGGPTYTLEVTAATLQLTGQSVGLHLADLLTVSPATLQLAGQSVGLHLADLLTVSPATLQLSGQEVDLTLVAAGDLSLIVEPAVLHLVGQQVSLTTSADITLEVAPATVELRGQRAAFGVMGVVEPAPTTPLAVQRGVLSAVQIALAGTEAKVFDHVPHAQAFPFVAMDLHDVRQNDGCEIHGFVHDFYLSVWSEYRGQKEVWEILDRLWRALHDQHLPLENGTFVLCQVLEQRSDRDADGLTFMGRLTARIHSNPYGNV